MGNHGQERAPNAAACGGKLFLRHGFHFSRGDAAPGGGQGWNVREPRCAVLILKSTSRSDLHTRALTFENVCVSGRSGLRMMALPEGWKQVDHMHGILSGFSL